jgi:hypothetical protein
LKVLGFRTTSLGPPKLPGPYYPLGTIGTVLRAYDIFRAYEGMEGRKNKNKKLKIKNRKM